MSVLFKTSAVHWDQNESTGYRRIGVSYNGNNIVAINANKVLGEWKSQVVPMGYSYGIEEVEVLADLYTKMPYIMNFIERDVVLTHEEMLEFLNNFQ